MVILVLMVVVCYINVVVAVFLSLWFMSFWFRAVYFLVCIVYLNFMFLLCLVWGNGFTYRCTFFRPMVFLYLWFLSAMFNSVPF